VSNSFKGQKPTYNFGALENDPEAAPPAKK
jgi:hypothetical protein